MRENHRSARVLDGLERGPKAGVRAIYDHSCRIQSLDELQPKSTQALIGTFLAAVTDMVLDVICELNDPDAEALIDVDKIEALYWIRTLNVEVNAQPAGTFGCLDILGPSDE